MSQQVNGSCQEVSESYPQSSAHFNPLTGMLEVGEGPPAPPWLEAIVSSLVLKDRRDPLSLKSDAFVALLFVLVHEVGFSVRGLEQDNPRSTFDVRILRKLTDIDSVDRKEFSYIIHLALYKFDSPCELIIVPSNNIFIVNFHIPDVETFCVSYKIDDYVSVNSDQTLKYSNLNRLSRSFKEICHKVRNVILDHVNLPSLHITNVPYEILLKISSYLDWTSFIKFSNTCKQFRTTLFDDESIWKRFYKIHFPKNIVSSQGCSWKKLFSDEAKSRLLPERFNRYQTRQFRSVASLPNAPSLLGYYQIS